MDRVLSDTSLYKYVLFISALVLCIPALSSLYLVSLLFINHSAYPYIFLHFYYYIVSVLIESTNSRIKATPKNYVMQCIMYKQWSLMGERVLARERTV